MAYRHNTALHRHKKRARHWGVAAIAALSFVFVGMLVVAVDWVINQASNSNTIVSRTNTATVQSANISVYRTEFFQFQAPDDWILVDNQSSKSKYVYVKENGDLITQRLTVYVNRPEQFKDSDLKNTHVLPIEKNTLGKFVPIGEVSEHCRESFPDDGNRNPRRITHNEVSFVCSPDSGQYNIIAGLYGGVEDIPVTLNNGEEITLAIIYSDLTAYPGVGDIKNIISSFNTL